MTGNSPRNSPSLSPFHGPAGGVLFDIDETIVDLFQAMQDAMVSASAHLLPNFTPAQWDDFAALYMADAHEYYDRYVLGEFSFAEQRGLRARAVFEHLGYTGFDVATERRWIVDFEEAQPHYIRAFEDVVPLLDTLDAAGIPYGAVSNNVHDYQRRQLGTAPSQTLYVGDNFLVDGVGSIKAGMLGVWLNRDNRDLPEVPKSDAAAAAAVLTIGSLASILEVMGLSIRA